MTTVDDQILIEVHAQVAERDELLGSAAELIERLVASVELAAVEGDVDAMGPLLDEAREMTDRIERLCG